MTTKTTGIKRLIYDIETSPNIGFFWRAGYDQNIGPDNIIKERKVICIAYKWEGEAKVHVLRWDSNQDDKAMLEAFLPIANKADELVAHYGDKFDLPWFKTRCLFHGLEPLPQYKTVDTKAWASKYFYFNSNKLDYLGGFLGFGHKIKTEFDLWKDIVLKKCPKALDRMCKYCARDVDLLEQVYHKLSKCVRTKTHVGVFSGLDKWTCAHCGSTDVSVSKRRVTASGTVQWQMRCNKCGGYYTISKQAHAAYLASKKAK